MDIFKANLVVKTLDVVLAGHTPPRSRDMLRPRFAKFIRPKKREQKTHMSIQVQRKQSGLPCAMVLRLFVLSPARPGLFVTVIPKKLAS
jgi:hypothetical protein